MRRSIALMLFLSCVASAKHGIAINSVVSRMRPSCDSITHAQDESEDWLWWVNACGEVLWCRHDERGEMVCGERDALPLPVGVVEAARASARGCVAEPLGRKEVNRALWRVSLCAHALDCELIGGGWTCRRP